jgi:hypothetical protein
VRIVDLNDEAFTIGVQDQPLVLEVEYQVFRPIRNLHTYINLFTIEGIHIFGTASWDSLGLNPDALHSPGLYVAKCMLPPHMLNQGTFYASVNGQVPGQGFIYKVDNVIQWDMSSLGGAGGLKSTERPGVLRPLLSWSVDCKE